MAVLEAIRSEARTAGEAIVIEKEGKPIRIEFMQFPSEIHGRVRGAACADGSGYVVMIDKDLPEDQKRRTVIHELAHIFLGHFDGCTDMELAEAEADQVVRAYNRQIV